MYSWVGSYQGICLKMFTRMFFSQKNIGSESSREIIYRYEWASVTMPPPFNKSAPLKGWPPSFRWFLFPQWLLPNSNTSFWNVSSNYSCALRRPLIWKKAAGEVAPSLPHCLHILYVIVIKTPLNVSESLPNTSKSALPRFQSFRPFYCGFVCVGKNMCGWGEPTEQCVVSSNWPTPCCSVII